jgi:hypothetical protein
MKQQASIKDFSVQDNDWESSMTRSMEPPIFGFSDAPTQLKTEMNGICEDPRQRARQILQQAGSGSRAAQMVMDDCSIGDEVVSHLLVIMDQCTKGFFARYLGRKMSAAELKDRFNESTLISLYEYAGEGHEQENLGKAALDEAGVDLFSAQQKYKDSAVDIPEGQSGERIIVVGTEVHYDGFNPGNQRDWFKWTGLTDGDDNNKLMFMEQAIAQVKAYQAVREENQASGKGGEEKITVVVFPHGYSVGQLKAFQSAVFTEGADNMKFLIENETVTEADQLINYMNTGDQWKDPSECTRGEDKVANVDVFSHGLPGQIAFGYDADEEIAQNHSLNISQAHKLSPEAFLENARWISYACRSATDINGAPDLSIAQEIANAAQIEVLAYRRRSDYSKSFADFGEIDEKLRNLAATIFDDETYRLKIDGYLFDSRGAAGSVNDGPTPGDQPEGQHQILPLEK